MSIKIEMQKAQKAMADELSAAEQRLKKSEEALVALTASATAALEKAKAAKLTAQHDFATLQIKYKQFLELFPLDTTAVAAKAPKEAKEKAPRGDMTVIEKMVSVMGDKSMTARQVEDALVAAGLVIKSNNTRGYISSLLGTQTKKVKGADGVALRDPITKEFVRALVFKKVDRGLYQVNKVDSAAIMAELGSKPTAQAPAGNSEVLLVDTGKSPADALFQSQGLDVDSLVSNNSAS